MQVIAGTLARYFGLRFLNAALMVFVSIFALIAPIDYIELMRRATDVPDVSLLLVAKTSLFRVPQLCERMLPFCVLIGAMFCYLNLSRRMELVVARAAGMSAWQFVAPAAIMAFLLGIFATTVYNPVSAFLQEQSKRYETELFGQDTNALSSAGGSFWASQKDESGQKAIINAKSSRDQGISLTGVSVFLFDTAGHFRQRVEARTAELQTGVWILKEARVYALSTLPVDAPEYSGQDEPNAGTGPGKLCDTRICVFLGPARVYQHRGTRWSRGRRL